MTGEFVCPLRRFEHEKDNITYEHTLETDDHVVRILALRESVGNKKCVIEVIKKDLGAGLSKKGKRRQCARCGMVVSYTAEAKIPEPEIDDPKYLNATPC